MSKKDDLHIAILKYGRDELEDGITFKGLCDHIKEKSYKVNEYRMKYYFLQTYESLDQDKRRIGINDINFEDKTKYALTIESTFRLIEYEEFKSANKNALTANENSTKATRFATIAIGVSIFALFISSGFSYWQLSTATKINEEQLDRIIQLKYDDSTANKKIEEIIKNQNLIIDNQKENIEAILRKNPIPNQSSTTNTKQ